MMLDSRYYLVTQEREVSVSATSPAEAVALATTVFNKGVQGDTEGRPQYLAIKETSIVARVEY